MIAKQLTARHRSLLRAVAEGRGHLGAGSPTLSVDGRWCDFMASRELITHQLVGPAWPAAPGTTAPAGQETLAALSIRTI